MKIASAFAMGWIALCGIAPFASAGDVHTVIAPNDVKWGPAPDVLPPGAEAALLFGDPSKEGLFVLRLKFPAGYRVAPHIHPVDEVLTVMSGSFSMGMGENADRSKAQTLPAGSFLPFLQAWHTTSSSTKTRSDKFTPTVRGDLVYINPKDDPRREVAVKSRSHRHQRRPSQGRAVRAAPH